MLLNENDITVDAESAEGNKQLIESCQLEKYSASDGYFDQIVSLKLRKSGEISVRLSFSLIFLKKPSPPLKMRTSRTVQTGNQANEYAHRNNPA